MGDPAEEVNDNDPLDAAYKDYCEHRRELSAARTSSASLFDKYVLAGAGGALALSITVLGVVGKKPVHPWCLLVSWCCLASAAACILLNFHLTYQANTAAVDAADSAYAQAPENYRARYLKWEEGCKSMKAIEWLNVAALISIAGGVVFLVIFGGLNL